MYFVKLFVFLSIIAQAYSLKLAPLKFIKPCPLCVSKVHTQRTSLFAAAAGDKLFMLIIKTDINCLQTLCEKVPN
jgi:hypothetical protein